MKTVNSAGSPAPAGSSSVSVGGVRVHGLIALGILLVCGLVYFPLTRANYCGFDDTLELERLSFHDPGTLASDLRTVTPETFKYRPLFNTLNRITFQLGHKGAALFRARNIGAHLLTSIVVYGIGLILFESIPVAAAAALLFSLHPLANQAVTGTIWVLTPADFCLFLSFYLFLLSLRPGRYQLVALIACLVVGSVGVLTYDPVIFLYGLIPLYLCTWFVIERKLPPLRYLITLAVLALVFLAVWFSLRAAYLPHRRPEVTPFSTVLSVGMVYAVGVLQLLDPILATDLLGTPLPREALYESSVTIGWIIVVTAPAILMLVVLFSTMRRWRVNLKRRDWLLFGCLLIAWVGSLVPYLFFSNHPSETYNYVGIAFLIWIATRMLYAIATPAGGDRANLTVFAGVVGVIALLFGAATMDRNLRVKSCGDIVGKIFNQLPADELRSGKWDVMFSNVPDEPQTRMYGMYGYKGIDTVGYGEYGAPGIPYTVQFVSGNPNIDAHAVSPEEFTRRCASPKPNQMCFWVHSNGELTRVRSTGPASPRPF